MKKIFKETIEIEENTYKKLFSSIFILTSIFYLLLY